jgi:integrase
VDPESGNLKRKRIRLNRIKTKSERRKYASRLIIEINKKLENGWSPFYETDSVPEYIMLKNACQSFISVKRKEGRREDTVRTYESFIRILDEYIERVLGRDDMYIYAFTDQKAVEFLDYRFVNFDMSATTFNNYKRFYNLLWNWFIEHHYTTKNPFKGISKKKESEKERIIIDPLYRKMIKEDLIQRDPWFYIICMLCYHCLMRPKEIAMTKVGYFDLEHGIIDLPGHVTKNGKRRIVTIPNHLNFKIRELQLNQWPSDYFAFSKFKKPNIEAINTRKIDKWWDKLRRRLDLPKQIQFYSLKDTGIVQLLEDGISPRDVMELADHSSLDITTKYLKFVRKRGIDSIRNNLSEF